MYARSYEDVVSGDRPAFWWRLGPAETTSSVGAAGLNVDMANRTTGPSYAGPGIPGARSGRSTHTLGTSNVANAQGWYTTSTHTVPVSDAAGITYEVWFMQIAGFTAGRLYSLFQRSGLGGFWMSGNDLLFQTVQTGSGQFVKTAVGQFRWVHAVGIQRDGNSEFYVNGQRVRDISFGTPETGATLGATSATTYVGHTQVFDSRFYSFPGFIAEPAIYPYPLSPSQIYRHYMAGLGKLSPAWTRSLYPFTAAAPTPGGLTPITEGLPNRRVLMVSDRPR